MTDRLTITSDKGGVAFTFDLDITCEKSEIVKILKVAEKLKAYEEIGTVEECRKVMEKQRGRKINNRKLLRDFNKTPYSVRGDCPNCGSVGLLSMNTDYCNACGQKLDWSE